MSISILRAVLPQRLEDHQLKNILQTSLQRIRKSQQTGIFFPIFQAAERFLRGRIRHFRNIIQRGFIFIPVHKGIQGKVSLWTPCAMVFCDLNGLKRVNDEEGHSAGDRILKKAAAILREVFPDSEVYRAGVDEFMIIAEGMDEKTAAAKRKQIHDRAAAVEGLAFSTGVHVIRGEEDIRAAMRAADGEMYADKKAYYERHPERKSR